MVRLADDWGAGRQTCIDALCQYVRAQRPKPLPHEREVVRAIMDTLGDRLRAEPVPGRTWHGHDFDFSGAVIDGANLSGARFTAGTTDFSGVSFIDDVQSGQTASGSGQIDFSGAQFLGGSVVFDEAEFAGGSITFDHADFRAGTVSFAGARFMEGRCTASFSNARFTGADLDFGATFTGGYVGFCAQFTGGRIDFSGAELTGGMIDLGGSTFAGTDLDFTGVEFAGTDLTFFGAGFLGGRISFDRAVFAWGAIDFTYARFVSEVCFLDARFTGATVGFGGVKDWSCPPRFSGFPEGVPAGLLLQFPLDQPTGPDEIAD